MDTEGKRVNGSKTTIRNNTNEKRKERKKERQQSKVNQT